MPADPFLNKPLGNRSIWVACSAKKISLLSDELRELGADVTPFPVIEIRDIDNKGPLDRALASIGTYTWIIFTSVHGVTYFSKRFHELRINRDVLKKLKICAIGPATGSALKELGFEVNLVPARFVAEGVVEALGKYCGGMKGLAGSRILLPRAKTARDVLPLALKEAGAHVNIVTCYQTVKAELNGETIRRLTAEVPDLIVFTSSSTVKNMLELLGHTMGKNILRKATVAAIGPITADTVASYDKRVEIVPQESTIASLIQSIKKYYSRR
jgi:uroporphyrinogen III methyltransferase/synthase